MTAREIAAGIRKTHLLTVALAATAGKEGDLREACGLAEDAIEAAIAAAERRMKERATEVARGFGEPYAVHSATGPMMFRAVVDKIAAAILALLPEGDGWMPIDGAPKDHFPRLTWSPQQGQCVAFLDVTWAWWSIPNGDGPMRHPPTHYRPLPNPPTAKE